MGTVGVSLDRYLAYRRIRRDLIAAYKAGALGSLIDQVLALDFPDLPAARRTVADAARRSGISVREREGWMQPCPNCAMPNVDEPCFW